MKYIRIYTESKSMNNYYYEEQTGEMFILEQSKGGNGLSVGIIAGISLVIYAFVRKIEKPISFDANLLYWISVGIGVTLGVLIAGYMLKRAKRKIEKNVRIYPCGLKEKQAMAKQNHRYFFTYIFLILVMVGICAASHFLMIWVVPSVLVYAFLNSLMCLLTILLTIAFIGNHPIKGWKIASRILRGER